MNIKRGIFKPKQWPKNTLAPLCSWECMEYSKCQLFTSTYHLPQRTRQNWHKILISEPLHNISNHIKNIQKELWHQVPKENKTHAENIIATLFNEKEAQNSADHRKGLLIITRTGLLKTLKSISLPIFRYHFAKPLFRYHYYYFH